MKGPLALAGRDPGNMEAVSRRTLLTGALAAAAGSAMGAPESLGIQPASDRSLRVAFLTDVHLDLNPMCFRGLTRCLKKIASMNDQPDLVIQGGDLIMDALVRDARSVGRQYGAARELLQRHCKMPIEHVIGNHDIWAWSRSDAAQLVTNSRYGKRWWLNWTGYTSTYRSFDRNGWHFILLDSIMPDGRGYAARLDEGQMRWLEQDLAQTPSATPVCIVSHVPILSTAAMFFGPAEKDGHWHVPRSLMHIDARWIKDLLVKHPNVKTCFSGHIHMQNRIEYDGVSHYGMGAVCGAWWKGPMQETPPQFGIVDFYEDGSVHTTYMRC